LALSPQKNKIINPKIKGSQKGENTIHQENEIMLSNFKNNNIEKDNITTKL
jgi:hypothetical protein